MQKFFHLSILFFYSILMWMLKPFLKQKLKRRGKSESGYLLNIEERFGDYQTLKNKHQNNLKDNLKNNLNDDENSSSSNWIWIHAVSLGETKVAAILIEALREKWKQNQQDFKILLTHSTATGRKEGEILLKTGDIQVWFPWDTPKIVNRFLDYFKPRLGLLIETEIWPQLIAACQKKEIPLILVNARLNEKSAQSMKRFSFLSYPALSGLTAILAQTIEDQNRFIELNVSPEKIHVLGHLKFDAKMNESQIQLAHQHKKHFENYFQNQKNTMKKSIILFASSRETEEAMLLNILKKQNDLYHQDNQDNQNNMNYQWLIVPRHPQRFNEVANLFESANFVVHRRSNWQNELPHLSPETQQIWLGDSLGEMAYYYSLADIALLGGSFAPLGGQNLLEACACACPVVMGEHTFNFDQIAKDAQTAHVAIRVLNMETAVQTAQKCVLRDDWAITQKTAQDFAQSQKGATEKTVQIIDSFLSKNQIR